VDPDLTGSTYRAEAVTTSLASSQAARTALFGFTVFCSAFLLFQVQLIIAKYILPWFGGTPAVFTTCMLFFQILLLLGYSYAYLIDGRLSPRAQAVVHSMLIIIAVALLALRLSTWGSPLLPDSNWKPTNSGQPLLHIVGLLLASVALPYFLVSTTGPLLQAWYGRVCRDTPYRLYALSNAGSLIALVSYPVVVEPLLPLRVQAQVWGLGFLLFSGGCIATASRTAREDQPEPQEFQLLDMPPQLPTPSWSHRVIWLLLAATGSLSLLATTNRICQDVAVVPLLWVLPLSLYLLSFVVCFSSDKGYSRTVWSAGLGLATLLVCFVLYHPGISLVGQILIYSFALFASCMVCHGELVQLKPPKEYLTSLLSFRRCRRGRWRRFRKYHRSCPVPRILGIPSECVAVLPVVLSHSVAGHRVLDLCPEAITIRVLRACVVRRTGSGHHWLEAAPGAAFFPCAGRADCSHTFREPHGHRFGPATKASRSVQHLFYRAYAGRSSGISSCRCGAWCSCNYAQLLRGFDREVRYVRWLSCADALSRQDHSRSSVS